MDLFAEVAGQQASESLAVTGLVASHLMDGVVDRIQVQSLSLLSQLGLAHGSAILGLYAHLQVLLGGIGNHFAQQLGKLGSVLGLFVSGLFPVQADLRIMSK